MFSLPLHVISIIIWLLVPLRQWRGKFFYFFLILGLLDILVSLFYDFLGIEQFNLYILSSYLLIVSLQTKYFIKKYRYLLILLFGLAFIAATPYQLIENQIILLTLHIIILVRILYLFIYDVGNFSRVNLFYVFLLLYEISVISKFLNLFLNLVDGATYFHFTTIFELFIGLFFIVFRYDNPRIVFQLK